MSGIASQCVGEWIVNSGIQSTDGGVARVYLSGAGRNAPVSSEITGYCASALVAIYRQTLDARYLDAAWRAARYLTRVAWNGKCRAMPFEHDTQGDGLAYFFDTGIVARGLLAVWRECGEPEMLSTALECGESMAEDFAESTLFAPVIQLPGKERLEYDESRWSRYPGCYQLKAALAWKELWLIAKEERFAALYRQALTACIANYRSFLPGSMIETSVMDRLHAYLYFLEGMFPCMAEPACSSILASELQRVADYIQLISPTFLRSDVLAQLLRVRLFADRGGIVSLEIEGASQEAELLQSFECAGSDVHLDGGFWFGRKKGLLLPFMNPVSTVFAMQALHMWDEYKAGHEIPEWQELI